jgi:hypothetical protein
MMYDQSLQPNLKALRRILAALIAGAVVTFGIALFLILHPPPRPRVTRAPEDAPVRARASAAYIPPRP